MRILNPVFSHEGVQYRDGKRHAWLVSLLVPASLASGRFLYQMLLDDVRQELAIWYLRQTDLSAEAIAERLGYSDTSNFSRTCKRWFGLTPRQIRQG